MSLLVRQNRACDWSLIPEAAIFGAMRRIPLFAPLEVVLAAHQVLMMVILPPHIPMFLPTSTYHMRMVQERPVTM